MRVLGHCAYISGKALLPILQLLHVVLKNVKKCSLFVDDIEKPDCSLAKDRHFTFVEGPKRVFEC